MDTANFLLFLILMAICYMAGREPGLLIGLGIVVVMKILDWIRDIFARRDMRECPHCLQEIPKKASVCSYCTRDVLKLFLHQAPAEQGAKSPTAPIFSNIREDLRKRVESMALDGSYSKAGIAIAIDLNEDEVERECVRLYQTGVITSDQCKRVLGRNLSAEEAKR